MHEMSIRNVTTIPPAIPQEKKPSPFPLRMGFILSFESCQFGKSPFILVSPSGMVETPRLQGEGGFSKKILIMQK
jgi:hypothetical protein